MEIATGQRDEEYEDDLGKNKAAAKLGRKGGMDFREATDKLCAKLRARLSNGRQPPDWPHAVIRLAEERDGTYRALIRGMQEAQR
jgi:hypothetical protein